MFPHPEGEGAPAAAELENAVAVLEVGALAGEGEHAVLRGFDVGDARVPVAGAVFHVGAEALLEEGGGELVVLLIGFIGGDGNGGGFEVGDVLHEELLAAFGVKLFEGVESFLEALSDAVADEKVWEDVLGEKVVDGAHGDLGGRGMKGLVVR